MKKRKSKRPQTPQLAFADFKRAGFNPSTKYIEGTEEVLDGWVHPGGPAAGEVALPGSTAWLQKRQEDFLKTAPRKERVMDRQRLARLIE